MREVLRIALELSGRLWALPNTVAGLLYGIVSLPFGAVADRANGVIRFTNMPRWLMRGAMSLGDVNLFGAGHVPDDDNGMGLGVCVGREEYLHTLQARMLGPLYLPAHLLGGLVSLLTPAAMARFPGTDRWHRNNFMEAGPMRGHVFRGRGGGKGGVET